MEGARTEKRNCDRTGRATFFCIENKGPMRFCLRRGPALGGVCLGKPTDSSQTRGRAGLPTRRSVHVMKALRSPIELAIAHRTTSADSTDDVVVSVQVQKSGDILPFGVQALAAEDVLEWLQPSGRRPEGCCCSTELSGGRGQVLGVAGYYTRPIMHAPHTLRLTLANIQRRTV